MVYTDKNKSVVEHWLAGISARSGNLSTDGKHLFSYDLLIGDILDEEYVVYDYTSPNFVSQTTSIHVGLAKKAGAKVITPSSDS